MMTMNKQQKQTQRALDRLERQYEKELIRTYQITLKELRGKLATLYEKTDGKWIEVQRYNRLAKLEKEIANEIGKLSGKSASTLKRGAMDAYEESYYRTAYVLSSAVKTDLGFSMLNRELVEKSIVNPLDRYGQGKRKDSLGFLVRNRDNHRQLTKQIHDRLTQALVQGYSYGRAAKEIKSRMDVGVTNVMRIAATEMHRTRNQAKLDSMHEGAEAGLSLKKLWLATVDGSTRESHQELDGVEIDLDKDFEGEEGSGPSPGNLSAVSENVNCRCDMIEVVDGFKPNKRRVRGVGVTEYASYKEFKEKGLIKS